MTSFELIQLFLGSGGLIGILVLFFWIGKFAQKVDAINHKMDDVRKENAKNFADLKCDIKEIKHSINALEVQMGKLETRVQERTYRIVQQDYDRAPVMR